MSYNTKNYTEQGGEKTVIGGTIDLTGATVVGVVTSDVVNNLTTTAAGKALDARQGKALKDTADALATTVNGKLTATASANQADSTEATSPTTAEFNALLTKLKASGLMVADV